MRRSSHFAPLDACGLNLQAVFDLEGLPPALAAAIAPFNPRHRYRQLILIGHGGRALWAALHAAGCELASENPVDDFSVATVTAWFAAHEPDRAHRVLYPGPEHVDLLALGRLAGWHRNAPLGLGVNACFGSWFAYRVVLLADTALTPTSAWTEPAPCAICAAKPCIAACPGGALDGGKFALDLCLRQRRWPASACRESCPARVVAPIAAARRYTDEQLRRHYRASLRVIERGC